MKCLSCGSSENVDKHHRSYNPEEIIPLCRRCHQRTHRQPNAPVPKYTTMYIKKTTRDALAKRGVVNENFDEVIVRLLEGEKSC